MLNLKIITLRNSFNEYTRRLKNSVDKFVIWGTVITLCFAIPLPIPSISTVGQGTNNFMIIFAYISDIFLIFLTLVAVFLKNKKISYLSYLLIFCLLIKAILLNNIFTLYTATTFTLFLVAYETIKHYGSKSISFVGQITKAISYIGAAQSFVVLYQWFIQKPLGLLVLGEPHFTSSALGIAKISIEEILVRPYGTFPHPNVLAAFLLTASLLTLLRIVQEKDNSTWKYVSFGIINLSLLTTFSRGVIILFLLSHILLLSIFIIKRLDKRKIAYIGLLSIGISIMFFSQYHSAITNRFNFSDEATKYRKLYNQIGWQIIKENPITGIGPGQTVFQMKHYTPISLKSWELQPIHNYYLLSWAELGVIGLNILLIIFLKTFFPLLKQTFQTLTKPGHYEQIIFTILIGSYFLLMFIDHYFYTLRQGQWMLWGILGIGAALIEKHHVSNET